MKEKFMQRAIELAEANLTEQAGGPFGAVIVKGTKIIGEGSNKVIAEGDPTAHAEVLAIRQACRSLGSYQLQGCEIYSSCEPCPMCLGAIYWSRLSRMYYAASRQDAEAAGFDDSVIYDECCCSIENRRVPTEQIMQAEARNLFDRWILVEEKVSY